MINTVTLAPDPLTDIGPLLLPVEAPDAGLRPNLTYKAIQEARREDNARLPQGVWVRDVKRANWPLVERLCSDALRTRAKDLQVACWLTEALIHRAGFAGLASGARLLDALCRGFWPVLQPPLDDGDIAPRLAPFEWMNTRFPALLRTIPIVRSAANAEESYSWGDYANARMLEALRQRDPKSVERSEAAGAVTIAAFDALRQRTDTGFWQETGNALQAAAAAMADLNASLEAICGRDAPGLGAISDTVKEIQGSVAAALAERRRKPLPTPASLFSARPPPPAPEPRASGQPPTREAIYTQLSGLAQQLHELDPHSPAPYLVRCAVAWGNLSFIELVTIFSNAGLDLGKALDLLGLADAIEATE